MQQHDPFDPEALCMPGADLETLRQRPSKKPPRHRPGEAFLKGPIPWPWLVLAARLPGQALQVALLLWREAGCRKCRTVPFCLSHGRELGVTVGSARRALRHLEAAGLVRVRRPPGRGLEVTLTDQPISAAAPPSGGPPTHGAWHTPGAEGPQTPWDGGEEK
jgi:hypothetical protein